MGNYAPNGEKYSGYSSKSYTAEEAAALGRDDGQAVDMLNSGYTGKCGFDNLTFTGKNWLEDKYYNFYTTSDASTACNGGECKSHSLSETAGWYGDYMEMIGKEHPWLLRGGYWYTGIKAGAFAYDVTNGNAGYHTFRLVLTNN